MRYGKAFNVNPSQPALRTLVAGLAVFAATVAAFVVLVVTDHATEAGTLMGAGMAIVVALLGIGHLSGVAHDTKQTVEHAADQVDRLANGEMDAKIKVAVGEQLDAWSRRMENWQPAPRAPGAGGVVDVTTRGPVDSPTGRSNL